MISAGLDLLLSEGLDPICAETAADAIREVESAGRRIVAAQTMILGSVAGAACTPVMATRQPR